METQEPTRDTDARETAPVSRNQNVVHILPHDMVSAANALTPHLERLQRTAADVQLLVIVPDPDDAIVLARALRSHGAARELRLIPASSARRATRLLRNPPTHGVIGAPNELLELVRTSTLKLEHVRGLVLAWVDDIVRDAASREALEAVLVEVPKEAARTIIATRVSPEVDEIVERYARRAIRPAASGDAGGATPIRYVTTSSWGKMAALQRLLDEMDPNVAAVFVRSDESAAEVRRLAESLGSAGEEAEVRVTQGAPVIEADTLVLLDVPSPSELRQMLGGGTATVIAIVQPRQLETLRALAMGGAVRPLATGTATTRARQRIAQLRAQLRDVLATGVPSHELMALEPLLEEFDGLEIAAAALRLLERDRESTREASTKAAASAPTPAPSAAPTDGEWTRLFIGAGSRDRVGPGDIVGAIVNEAGVARDRIGRIEVRENHSLTDVASADAERIAEALNGTSIRGRRATVRVDRGREGGGGRPSRDEGARPPRGDRPARGDRPSRGGRPSRDDVERRRPRSRDRE